MKYRIFSVIGVLIFSFAFSSTSEIKDSKDLNNSPEIPEIVNTEKSFEEKVNNLYKAFSLNSTSLPKKSVFEKAMVGYTKLEEEGKVSNPLLSIVDFDLSSTQKRLWILNMETREVVFNTFVAHGKNTGLEFADKFSNTLNSNQSSLGFYITGETYYGKNGLSLFIDGMEDDFNSNARKRYVVIHGADYAEPEFIDRYGRLGRSLGCPAVPNKIAKELINKIKGESVVYIHKNDPQYLNASEYLES